MENILSSHVNWNYPQVILAVILNNKKKPWNRDFQTPQKTFERLTHDLQHKISPWFPLGYTIKLPCPTVFNPTSIPSVFSANGDPKVKQTQTVSYQV